MSMCHVLSAYWKTRIVRDFMDGESMKELTELYQIPLLDIEQIIREAMNNG
jgi:Mor family transcriptional regulator